MIYKFSPILRPMIWGSELWVLSGYGERISVVSEGPDAGKTVNEVYGGEFPLLIKFIDAHQDLSIQVHPDEEMAQRVHGGHGKTEMWYVIGTEPGAHLYSGLNREITPDEYVQLVEQDRIVEVLSDHQLQPGDVFFLPAGRIHAICGGTYLAEIQQTSDLTYRIYDYGRKGADGKPRALHTDLARQAIDYHVYPTYRTLYDHKPDTEVELVKCPYFTTSLLELTGGSAVEGCPSARLAALGTRGGDPHESVGGAGLEEGRLRGADGQSKWKTVTVVICTEGSAVVNGYNLGINETILLLDEDLEISGKGKFLITHP